MPKYIEEKELREWVQNWFEKNRYYHPYSKSNDIPIPELYDILEQMPTADVVEVVRCKDCKWYGRADKRRFYRGMDCLQHRIDTIVPDKDFCSRGERRTDDDRNG